MSSDAGWEPAHVRGAGGASGLVTRPALFQRLGGPARVCVVSGSAGSGKTVLVRSWIGASDLAGQAAWVMAGRDERDPQRFWLSVLNALRATGPGAGLVRAVSAAPDLDGWALVERLLSNLAPLREQLWLVVDDAHELNQDQALRQLELFLLRAPQGLRFVLVTRHDLRLGLHRLRLEGQLDEIRAADLRFSLAEARDLFAAAGVELTDPAVAALHERTEGWAAGLRLAALAAAGHPDPARFAAEFSGTERTVAEYLLAEVLERQPEPVRRLLLRTSLLERVNGELADLLTGDEGAERALQDLETANAFVTSLNGARTWFRYHQLFAGLLRLELRRTAPDEIGGLHRAAARWLAEHGHPVDAVRHAQAAQDWDLAARLLADHWPGLHLDGRGAAIHELLDGFAPGQAAADTELAAVAAAAELDRGSLEGAERYLRLAAQGEDKVPQARRGQAHLLLCFVRLLYARQQGNLSATIEEARRLQDAAEEPEVVRPGLIEDLRVLSLISLGSTEYWAAEPDEAARHLERSVVLARRIGRPYLEFTGVAHWAAVVLFGSFTKAADLGREAAALAERHGWTDDPVYGFICSIIGGMLARQARLEEAEPWLQIAERVLGEETVQPAALASVRFVRGAFEMMRDRDSEALAAFQSADLLAQRVASPHYLIPWIRCLLLLTLVRLGRIADAGQFLAGLSDADRQHGEVRIAEAAMRLAQDDPRAALTELAPVLEGSAPVVWHNGLAQAYVLEAIARDSIGDQDTAEAALERALDLAEPDGFMLAFLLHPAPGLLERHTRHRTAHASLIIEIRGLLTGTRTSPADRPEPPLESLSGSEIRVLRYLPTNLTVPEIARQLSLSPNTVRTHIRSVYAKLGTHQRAGAVERARALPLLG